MSYLLNYGPATSSMGTESSKPWGEQVTIHEATPTLCLQGPAARKNFLSQRMTIAESQRMTRRRAGPRSLQGPPILACPRHCLPSMVLHTMAFPSLEPAPHESVRSMCCFNHLSHPLLAAWLRRPCCPLHWPELFSRPGTNLTSDSIAPLSSLPDQTLASRGGCWLQCHFSAGASPPSVARDTAVLKLVDEWMLDELWKLLMKIVNNLDTIAIYHNVLFGNTSI